MSEQGETLLENRDGKIVAHGPLLLVCDCRGGLLDALVRLYAPFALIASIVVSIIVSLRAAPPLILLIAISWTFASTVAQLLARASNRKHGRFRLDLENGELLQEGRGFSRRYALQNLRHITTALVDGMDAGRAEAGFEPRWLLLVMQSGQELRLGKAPPHQLRPVLLFLREAGVPVLPERSAAS